MSRTLSKLFKKNPKYQERLMGDFILGATLGVGGYAKVKLGIHKESGEKVAIKVLLADEKGKISDSKKKQTNRAIDLLAKVKHPNVLRLLAYEKNAKYPEADGTYTPCMMMALEHAGNGELFDYLMFTGHFEERVARSYFHQLINGLEAIHKLGFAHRDLKPENLLLDKDFNLKIADFGFATVFRAEDGSVTKMKTACGTKGYLAPEVLKGKKYEQSVDIFAAGIILFITYAGFPPFNDAIPTDWWWNRLENGWKERNAGGLLDKKREWSKHGLFWAAHERTRKFPQDLKDLLLKLLHPDHRQRPTIPQLRNEAWDFYKFPAKLYGSKEKRAKGSSQTKSWYQKETMVVKDLGRYLEKRRSTVRKERAKKIAEQQKAVSKEFKRQPRRSTDPNDQWDPNGSETFAMYQIRQHYMDRVKEIDPSGEFDKFIEDFSDGTFASTPFYFFTKLAPGIVAACFEKIATELHAQIEINPKDTRTVIRCGAQNDPAMEAEFEVKQFRFDSKYIVSCKRLRGDPLGFKTILNEFWEHNHVVAIMDIQDDLLIAD